MAAPVRLREDFDGPQLRALAKRARDTGQLRRHLAVAEIYEGRSRSEAARIGGVGLQTVHDWVLRFNARGPDGLIDAKHPGPRPKLNAEQGAALGRLVEDASQRERISTWRYPRRSRRISSPCRSRPSTKWFAPFFRSIRTPPMRVCGFTWADRLGPTPGPNGGVLHHLFQKISLFVNPISSRSACVLGRSAILGDLEFKKPMGA